jgi:hypothetical protein
MKKRYFLAIALALLAAGMLRYLPQTEAGRGAIPANEAARPAQPDPEPRPDDTLPLEPPSAKRTSRNPQGVPSPNDNSRKIMQISDAARSVVKLLEADELQRATLQVEEDSGKARNYSYLIQRREDLDDFVAGLIQQASTNSQLNKDAIRLEIEDDLGQFRIPQDCVQRIMISVPKDDNSGIKYASMNIKADKTDDLSGNFTSYGEVVTAEVKDRGGNWRYKKLLETIPPSDRTSN